MLNIDPSPNFFKIINKIKDKIIQKRVKKLVKKIIDNPEIGKSMKYARKGTREVYIKPFRISYAYLKNKNTLIFLDLYHKDKQ